MKYTFLWNLCWGNASSVWVQTKLLDIVSIPDSPKRDEIDLPKDVLEELLKDNLFYEPSKIVRSNRKGLPTNKVNKSASAVKQLKRGESIILMQGQMVCVTWKDSRVVNLISNLPGPLSLGEVDVQRREKTKAGSRVHHQETSCYQHLQLLIFRPACWYISEAQEISDMVSTNLLPFPTFDCCAGLCNIQRITSGDKERSESIHS